MSLDSGMSVRFAGSRIDRSSHERSTEKRGRARDARHRSHCTAETTTGTTPPLPPSPLPTNTTPTPLPHPSPLPLPLPWPSPRSPTPLVSRRSSSYLVPIDFPESAPSPFARTALGALSSEAEETCERFVRLQSSESTSGRGGRPAGARAPRSGVSAAFAGRGRAAGAPRPGVGPCRDDAEWDLRERSRRGHGAGLLHARALRAPSPSPSATRTSAGSWRSVPRRASGKRASRSS